jgi:hypothetical protein
MVPVKLTRLASFSFYSLLVFDYRRVLPHATLSSATDLDGTINILQVSMGQVQDLLLAKELELNECLESIESGATGSDARANNRDQAAVNSVQDVRAVS